MRLSWRDVESPLALFIPRARRWRNVLYMEQALAALGSWSYFRPRSGFPYCVPTAGSLAPG